LLKLVDGVLQYTISTHVITLSSTIVSDGKWHYVQVKWTSSELIVDVDYGVERVSLNLIQCCNILFRWRNIFDCLAVL